MKKTFLIVVCSVSSIFFSCKKDQNSDQLGSETAQTDANTLIDNGWPREAENNGTKLVYYQPQVDDWNDYKEITARLAFSLTPKDGKEVLGVASLKASTLVDKDNRNVFFRNIEVTDVRFPSWMKKQFLKWKNCLKKHCQKAATQFR